MPHRCLASLCEGGCLIDAWPVFYVKVHPPFFYYYYLITSHWNLFHFRSFDAKDIFIVSMRKIWMTSVYRWQSPSMKKVVHKTVDEAVVLVRSYITSSAIKCVLILISRFALIIERIRKTANCLDKGKVLRAASSDRVDGSPTTAVQNPHELGWSCQCELMDRGRPLLQYWRVLGW
jgi:hypothetical protein